ERGRAVPGRRRAGRFRTMLPGRTRRRPRPGGAAGARAPSTVLLFPGRGADRSGADGVQRGGVVADLAARGGRRGLGQAGVVLPLGAVAVLTGAFLRALLGGGGRGVRGARLRLGRPVVPALLVVLLGGDRVGDQAPDLLPVRVGRVDLGRGGLQRLH